MKMANIRGRLECKVEIIVDVDCHCFGLDMAIVLLVHAMHVSSLGMHCRSTNENKNEMDITTKPWR